MKSNQESIWKRDIFLFLFLLFYIVDICYCYKYLEIIENGGYKGDLCLEMEKDDQTTTFDLETLNCTKKRDNSICYGKGKGKDGENSFNMSYYKGTLFKCSMKCNFKIVRERILDTVYIFDYKKLKLIKNEYDGKNGSYFVTHVENIGLVSIDDIEIKMTNPALSCEYVTRHNDTLKHRIFINKSFYNNNNNSLIISDINMIIGKAQNCAQTLYLGQISAQFDLIWISSKIIMNNFTYYSVIIKNIAFFSLADIKISMDNLFRCTNVSINGDELSCLMYTTNACIDSDIESAMSIGIKQFHFNTKVLVQFNKMAFKGSETKMEQNDLKYTVEIENLHQMLFSIKNISIIFDNQPRKYVNIPSASDTINTSFDYKEQCNQLIDVQIVISFASCADKVFRDKISCDPKNTPSTSIIFIVLIVILTILIVGISICLYREKEKNKKLKEKLKSENVLLENINT